MISRSRIFGLILTIAIVAVLPGCKEKSTPPVADGILAQGNLVAVDIDKRNPRRLLEFYLNDLDSSGAPGLEVRDGRFLANLDVINQPGREALQDSDGDGVIDWPELEAFVLSTYYELRGMPQTTEHLRSVFGDWHNEDEWFRLSVNGVMTSAARSIYVRRSHLEAAIGSFSEGNGLRYPDSTLFVAEHISDDVRVEVTIMVKRGDGLWDYAAYDSTGTITQATSAAPKSYRVPTQCVGCHYGNRSFEPEGSYPGEAPDGPTGARVIREPTVNATAGLVAHFDEHAKRTDTILGLYATMYIAQLRQKPSTLLTDNEQMLLDLIPSD